MRKMLLMMLLVICTLSINAQSASNKDATIVSDIQYKPQFGIVQATNPSCLLYFP